MNDSTTVAKLTQEHETAGVRAVIALLLLSARYIAFLDVKKVLSEGAAYATDDGCLRLFTVRCFRTKRRAMDRFSSLVGCFLQTFWLWNELR